MVKKEKVVRADELGLDEMLLERLRGEAATIRKWVKVKKAGLTQAVVDQVHFVWRKNELALLKFDLPLCRNMHRAREIVEMMTGGAVVWSNKDFLAVYRGCNYKSGSKNFWNIHRKSAGAEEIFSSTMNHRNTTTVVRVSPDGSGLDEMVREKDGEWESLHMPSLYEREADRLLDGLGPRFVDWWMQTPLPVDADLLPELVPGFKTPFRICPPFTRSKLTDAELTYLRKLARPLPTHFVLGRNRKLQGLAAAHPKMWEKCHIAKIALKWGIPNTDNEQMANELKARISGLWNPSEREEKEIIHFLNLTGGVLLLRNKFLIILYRGKDFIPSEEVGKVVAEREMELTRCQLQEETARLKASEAFSITDEDSVNSGIVGTLSEFQHIHSEIGNHKKRETEIELKKKIEKSAKILEKLKNASRFSEQDPDVEVISKEERQCLREMGLKIDSSLVLGSCFWSLQFSDQTSLEICSITMPSLKCLSYLRDNGFLKLLSSYSTFLPHEGIHQHWKHREIVKVVTMQKKLSQVMHTAKCLEAESGGILVNVIKLKEGHAIILYRGKNYKRPKSAAQNLLSKREALSRSLEIQRLGSLKFFANQKSRAISINFG
ncbi:Chloroplastic group IIA intron splicing facilitator CRS1, chloroplastic [Sesamum angolense]|uniref:Chloroplastic group IIA intron splicing facilitator CRS1, chloroplastic n=1 Tax=Sesamum angolense TaxID=2727404 RepID=A0AAE2BQ37_9LAMI|nr:Chloroplastic group IIA intron splicing facilitator CRS1, chloroplastic [Sesamum angolense]